MKENATVKVMIRSTSDLIGDNQMNKGFYGAYFREFRCIKCDTVLGQLKILVFMFVHLVEIN